eukprot:scpid61286/ scgid16156/ 
MARLWRQRLPTALSPATTASTNRARRRAPTRLPASLHGPVVLLTVPSLITTLIWLGQSSSSNSIVSCSYSEGVSGERNPSSPCIAAFQGLSGHFMMNSITGGKHCKSMTSSVICDLYEKNKPVFLHKPRPPDAVARGELAPLGVIPGFSLQDFPYFLGPVPSYSFLRLLCLHCTYMPLSDVGVANGRGSSALIRRLWCSPFVLLHFAFDK